MEAVRFSVGGPPVAKGRPRMTRTGIMFTPAKTRKYEAHARLAAQEAMNGRPPLTCAVYVSVAVWLPIPSSWSKKKQALALSGRIGATKRPDVDNYVKSALDSINGIVIADDSQVIDLLVSKRYATTPELAISVRPLHVDNA